MLGGIGFRPENKSVYVQSNANRKNRIEKPKIEKEKKNAILNGLDWFSPMFILFFVVLYVVFVVLLESYFTRKYGLCPSTCMEFD